MSTKPKIIKRADQKDAELEAEIESGLASIWGDKPEPKVEQKQKKNIWKKPGQFSPELKSEIGKSLWMKKKTKKGGAK